MPLDDPKVVYAQLPPCLLKHPVRMKDLRGQWDYGCARLLQEAHLTTEQKCKVVMDWLSKAGVRDYVLAKLILNFARPLPVPPTEEQRKERRQKTLVKLAYTDELPHLRAVNRVVTERLENAPLVGTFKEIDDVDDREKETPGAMFAEFAASIETQVQLEYKAVAEQHPTENPFADAAQ